MNKSFKDLKVWQESINLVQEIYKHTMNFPKEEMYGLTSQIRRAAISIPSNIAEGQSRSTKKVFSYFLSISTGSVAELETQIIIAEKLSFINKELSEKLQLQINSIGRMLTGLRKSLATSH